MTQDPPNTSAPPRTAPVIVLLNTSGLPPAPLLLPSHAARLALVLAIDFYKEAPCS